jgi:hypothetical protein
VEEEYSRFGDVRQASGKGLGSGQNLFVSTLVEWELVPAFAQKNSVPGAPILFRANKYKLPSALFARNDELFGRTLHEYTSFALLGITFVHLASQWRAGGNITHSRDGHKINDTVLQATVMLDAKVIDHFKSI